MSIPTEDAGLGASLPGTREGIRAPGVLRTMSRHLLPLVVGAVATVAVVLAMVLAATQ